jgi:DNA-binding CsgD family transcriptional regulator
MTDEPGPSNLIGRDDEMSVITAMLRGDGGSGLLLVGEPGIGKSALLDAARRAAARDGRTVLRATGAQAEVRVPFAGLHQLLYPLTDRFGLLAPPQRKALLAAFGCLDGPALQVFLIAIATLELLADAAGCGLLVVVDDLHWIDDATAQVLSFVARRMATEPIALLAATRPGHDDPLTEAGVPVRTLRPLHRAEAERLVELRHPDLDERRRAWVVEHAEGNPLALAELPLAAGAGQPGTGARIPLTARLERSFADGACAPCAELALELGRCERAGGLAAGAEPLSHLVGGDESVTAVRRALVDGARREGRLAALPRLLTQQSWNAIAIADWQAAVPAADEAVRLAAETRQPQWQAAAMTGQAMIAGMRGDDAAAGRLAQAAEALALPPRISTVLCGIQFARGVTAIAAGRYDEAFDQLRRVFDRADPSCQQVQSSWVLGDLAEAAAHTGRTAEAREIAAACRSGDRDSVTPWARVALLYAAPLLAGESAAEPEFHRALAADLARWPSYRARLLLEYGSWLRRRYRVAEARGPLRTARQICEAHGLLPWAERARRELRAAGEAGEELRAQQRTTLSPQEFQIAQLAAEGLSNREIAQRLYLSHRTVGSHLYRIFPKLGITSRIQLPSVLATAGASPRR